MILCITEKPTVGSDIAKILGASTRHDGYYEGNGYCVTWTYGHLCTLKEPHDYCESWQHWSLGQLPMIPSRFGIKLLDDKGVERQFRVIESLVSKAEKIINCGDAGQEGELIQRWVLQKAGCKKPVERLWISSLTDEAIKDGFKHLKASNNYDSLYNAGLCRAIGDWVLGLNATRLYTLKYRRGPGAVLSIGRVQTPTLALIVNRQKEIENFVAKNSWELRTVYRGATFVSTLQPFETEEKGAPLLKSIIENPFVITSVQKKKGTEAPPRLFDLTSLQVECNRKYGLTAQSTLQAVQSLYEKKLSTYPRVDTTYLTTDIYPKCGSILNGLTPYQKMLEPLRGQRLRKSKKVFDNSKVTDHHAIIPTGISPEKASLTEDEKKVYDTITRRFISVFYPDSIYEQTQVRGEVKRNDDKPILFKASGKVVTLPGWKEIYSSPSDVKEDTLPIFQQGECGPHKPLLAKKTTQPPKYFTDATLLKAMETAGSLVESEDLREALKANGLGRPSTRAGIIELLTRRGYIKREKKSLRATEAGITLISLIREDLLKSAELTGIWERRLRMIESEQYEPSEFIAQIKELINQITISVMSDNSSRRIDSNTEKTPTHK